MIFAEGSVERVLEAGGLNDPSTEGASLSERLERIASAFLTLAYTTRKASRGRLRKKLGKEARIQLFRDIEGVWIEFSKAQRLASRPAEAYDAKDGQFVTLVQAISLELAEHLQRSLIPASEESDYWRGVTSDLRKIGHDVSAVRNGMNAAGLDRLNRALRRQG